MEKLTGINKSLNGGTAGQRENVSSEVASPKNRFLYGTNMVTGKPVRYDRFASESPHGIVFGNCRSNKTDVILNEIQQACHTENAQVIIIDTEHEYVDYAESHGGKVITIKMEGNNFINIFDLNIGNDVGLMLAQKIDGITAFIQTVFSNGNGRLPEITESIIGETVWRIYQPYIENLRSRHITMDTTICPTLKDFFDDLVIQGKRESRELSDAIHSRIHGFTNLNIYAHHTNISSDDALIVYDLSEVRPLLQSLGVQACLSDMWNRMISNGSKQIKTWGYINGAHWLLHNDVTAHYLSRIWKRSRMWWGVLTLVAEDIEDVLHTESGKSVLNNAGFLQVLPPLESRELFERIFAPNETQRHYIESMALGEKLLYAKGKFVPVENAH